MTWSQLCGWMAYYEIEPWGELIEDRRVGNIAAAIYNVNRVKKSSKVWSWVDFATVDTSKKRSSKPITEEGWRKFKASLLAAAGKKKSKS